MTDIYACGEILGKREAINPQHVLESSSPPIKSQSTLGIDQDILDKEIFDAEIAAAASAQNLKLSDPMILMIYQAHVVKYTLLTQRKTSHLPLQNPCF